MAGWRIELIGGLRAVAEDRAVDRFPTRRTAGLLAYLALNLDVQHSRDFLAELLWPEAPHESQRHSLRLALSRLRALLGPNHPIESSRSHVWMRANDVVTDVVECKTAIDAGDYPLAKRLLRSGLAPGLDHEWIVEAQVSLELALERLGSDEEKFRRSLPGGLRKMFGRQADLERLDALFEQNKVVSITGIGGIGKTRLAVEYAHTRRSPLWISLIDVGAPNQIADFIRNTIRAPVPDATMPLTPYVSREIAALSPDLVVLDNADNVIGPELNELLAHLSAVPNVSVLVTSRWSIQFEFEAAHALKPVGEEAGAEIFKDRVHAVRQIGPVPDAVLARIARRQGGIPLAIELCAARVGIQSIRELEQGHYPPIDQLGESLGIPGRQQNLVAVLESSLEVLSPGDRQALADLCVFRGGFDAQAAAAVAQADLNVLERLRRCGLVVAYDSDESVRFRIPEPLRGIGLEDGQRSYGRHALYFADWVESNRADHLPPPPYRFGFRLDLQNVERFNVSAALRFCLTTDELKIREAGLRIVAAYWTHWFTTNESTKMETWATSLLADLGEQADLKIQAAARLSLGLALRERGDHLAFSEQVNLSIRAFDREELHRDAAFAWHLSGLSLSDLGDYVAADEAYGVAEEIWTKIGDMRNYSVTRHNRAMVALGSGSLEHAETLVWEALEIFSQHQSTYLGVGYSTLAQILGARNDPSGAADAFRKAIQWNKKLGYVRGWAQNSRDLALAAHQLGREEEALAQASGALRDFRRIGDRHGEATALCALAKISGEMRYEDEARALVARHDIELHHELLQRLRSQ